MTITKKTIEPFNLFGQGSLINSKEEAAKILKDNNYYIFITAVLVLVLYLLLLATKSETFVSRTTILTLSIYYFALTYAIHRYKSRVASILALVTFTYIMLLRLTDKDIGGMFFFSVLLVAASYRCVKASFFYHKKDLNKKDEQFTQ